ncbi:MAG TPA: lyase family protein [Bryobacteraceae bacterium]|nr:lyase family protein [Bryobacteraceae bacterium]
MPRGLIGCLTTTDALAALFSDESVLQSMLDFEAALARAESRCGLISAEAAEAIAGACEAPRYDAHALAVEIRRQAAMAIPVVKALTENVRQVSPLAARFVHWGATTQDVTDTALVILLGRARAILAADHKSLLQTLRRLSNEHAKTVMLGRTLLQAAPPVTLGLKVAGWYAALRRDWTRLDSAFEEGLALEFGGASGTLAALAEKGGEVARLLGEELGLPVPDAPWHAHRDRLAAIVADCGIYTASLGKIARDAVLLMQQEVGEAEESGGGGSSTMPHKRNPSSFAIVLACANRTPGLVADFLAGMLQEHERGVGGLHAEWMTISNVVEAAGSALAAMAHGMDRLVVHPERMAANIRATKGLVFSERVMMQIAAATGRDAAHALLSEASRIAIEREIPLAVAISLMPDIAELLTPEQIAALDVPEDYLGSAEKFRRGLLGD